MIASNVEIQWEIRQGYISQWRGVGIYVVKNHTAKLFRRIRKHARIALTAHQAPQYFKKNKNRWIVELPMHERQPNLMYS